MESKDSAKIEGGREREREKDSEKDRERERREWLR